MIDSGVCLPRKHLNYGYEFIPLKIYTRPIIGTLLAGIIERQIRFVEARYERLRLIDLLIRHETPCSSASRKLSSLLQRSVALIHAGTNYGRQVRFRARNV